jgi:hypothetical protein
MLIKSFPYQNDSGFPDVYNEKGCYAHVIAKIAFDEDAFSIDPVEMINSVLPLCVAEGVLDNEYTVWNPERLFCFYGLWVSYTDRWEPMSRRCAADEREALRFYYEREGRKEGDELYHFVEGNGDGRCEWDPWHGGSNAVRYGRAIDKRVFKVIGRTYGGGC